MNYWPVIRINMVPYFLFLIMTTADSSNMTGFIVGGFMTDIHQWPFIVFIHARGTEDDEEVTASCGGSLLSSQTVLSAAHCFDDLTDHHKTFNNYEFTVYMGHSRFDKALMIRNVEDYTSHQKYDPHSKLIVYDISVAFLNVPVRFSDTVKKVILVPKSTDVKKDEQVMVAGWGMTDTHESPGSTKLKAAFQLLDTTRSCQSFIHHFTPGVICASPASDYAYRGDSGGPLIRKKDKFQVGIISYRLPRSGVTVYSSVSYYYSWIQETQAQLFNKFCPGRLRMDRRRLRKRKNTRREKTIN